MCFPPVSTQGGLTVELTQAAVDRYRAALTAILSGDANEPDHRVLREINVRLKHATRKRAECQQSRY